MMQRFAFFRVEELYKDYWIMPINNPTKEHPDKQGNPFPYIREGDGLKNGNIGKSSNKTKNIAVQKKIVSKTYCFRIHDKRGNINKAMLI